MLLVEIRAIKSSPKELRSFGLTVGAVCTLIAFWIAWRHQQLPVWLLILGGALMGGGLAAPRILKPFQKAWMILALCLGAVVSRIILVILFYVVVTPIGLMTRALGKDFLDRRFGTASQSYWVTRKGGRTTPADYERQF